MVKNKNAHWTLAELEYLKEYYGALPESVICEKLQRTWSSIMAIASRYGIKSNKTLDKHICWNCKHATNVPEGYCSWADRLEPVAGWKTKSAKTKRCGENNTRFNVIECPLFDREPPRKVFEEVEEYEKC